MCSDMEQGRYFRGLRPVLRAVLLAALACRSTAAAPSQQRSPFAISLAAGQQHELAARELRRVLYVATGMMPAIGGDTDVPMLVNSSGARPRREAATIFSYMAVHEANTLASGWSPSWLSSLKMRASRLACRS